MFKLKKTMAIVLAAVVVSSALLASCKKADGASASGADTSNGTLTIGVDDTYPPMEFQDPNSDKDVGFDIDMANAIGKSLKKKVVIQSISWDGIFNALNAKKFDCIISSVSMTEEREQNYLFTKPYIANAQMIVVKKGDKSITKKEDLKGTEVAAQVNTTANDSANTLVKNGIALKLTTYDQIIQCFQALKAGKAKAVIVDEVVGEYYIKQSPKDYQSAAVNLTNEPIGVCFRKDDSALRDSVQTAIDGMVKDGSMKKISVKWFGKDLTSNIDETLRTLE